MKAIEGVESRPPSAGTEGKAESDEGEGAADGSSATPQRRKRGKHKKSGGARQYEARRRAAGADGSTSDAQVSPR